MCFKTFCRFAVGIGRFKRWFKKHFFLMVFVFGISYILTSSILLYVTFLMAFFQKHSVVVKVNEFGEANIEFILFPLGLVCGMFSLYCLFIGKCKIKLIQKG